MARSPGVPGRTDTSQSSAAPEAAALEDGAPGAAALADGAHEAAALEDVAHGAAGYEAFEAYEATVAGYTAAGADEDVQRVVTALSRISRRLDLYYRRQLAELELHRGDWGVLSELALHSPDSTSTPSRLADVIGVSPSTMTHRLDQLVERGLVRRTQDLDNRTRMRIELTRTGRELFQRAVREADVTESAVLSALSAAERVRLADLLEKVLGA